MAYLAGEVRGSQIIYFFLFSGSFRMHLVTYSGFCCCRGWNSKGTVLLSVQLLVKSCETSAHGGKQKEVSWERSTHVRERAGLGLGSHSYSNQATLKTARTGPRRNPFKGPFTLSLVTLGDQPSVWFLVESNHLQIIAPNKRKWNLWFANTVTVEWHQWSQDSF